jgi:plastocyanin domain-containing protein
MSNHKIVFYGTEKSETSSHELTAFHNTINEIYITIKSGYNEIPDWICLDKETAIKLTRVLKSEISKIK